MTDRKGTEYEGPLYMGLPVDYVAKISPEIIELQATMADPSSDITASTVQLMERIDTCAQENPDSSYWDSIKRSVIADLLAVDQPDLAIEVFWTMTSGHVMATALAKIQQEASKAKIASLNTEIYAAAPYFPNISRTIQAVRDNFIASQPDSEITRSFNDFLIQSGIEVDTVEGWIDSQTELYNGVDWSVLEKELKDEDTWKDTPVENRLYLANTLLIAIEQLYDHNLTEEEAILLVGTMKDVEARFPDQTYTDLMRAKLACAAFDAGSIQIGISFANLIKEEDFLFQLTQKLDEQGDTAQAFQLANSMGDPALTLKLLLDTDWQDKERSTQLIMNLLYGDLESVDRRIGYFTMLCERCIERSEFAEAAEIQGTINKLKNEQS